MSTLHPIDDYAMGSALRIYCLGAFRIAKPDEQSWLGISSKHKMWTLLKYLIIKKGSVIATEEIIERFWPEQRNPKDTSPLRTTLSRLKAELEAGETINSKRRSADFIITYRKEACMFNSGYPVWLDFESFEDLCNSAYFMAKQNSHEAIAAYMAALDLYQGDFLADDPDWEWAMAPREYYRRLFLNSTRELAKLLMKEANLCLARRFVEQAIKLESYAEDLHSLLIRILYETGDIHQAKTVYSNYSALIYRELGIRPSEELKQLYQLVTKIETPRYSPVDTLLAAGFQDIAREGPFISEPDFFASLLEIEQRRVTRGGEACLILFAEGKASKGRENPYIEKLEAMAVKSLRKSDIVCSLNWRNLVLLLPNTGRLGGETVAANILSKCGRENGWGKTPPVHYKCMLLSSGAN